MIEIEKVGLKNPTGWGARHTLAFFGFWAFALSYAMRFNISIAIVSMVKANSNSTTNGRNTNLKGPSQFFNVSTSSFDESHSVLDACPHLINDHITENKTKMSSDENGKSYSAAGEFQWTALEQGVILGSFFWGYVVTQMPGGMLAHKYGGKWPLGIGLFISGLATVFTPLAARSHKYVLCFARVICGLGEGFAYPSMYGLLSEWAPSDEKSTLCSIIYAGAQFGTAATMIVSGYLIDGNVFGGWPSVFYVIGGLTLVWFAFWCYFVYDSPEEHPRISSEELEYIEKSTGKQQLDVKGDDVIQSQIQITDGHIILKDVIVLSTTISTAENEPKQNMHAKAKRLEQAKLPTPWRAIFSSMPFWAIVIGNIGYGWGLYTLLHELPTYLDSILHFDVTQNSWLSALPYILMWILSILYTQIMDHLISKKILRTVVVRKLSQSIAHLGAAALLIAASYSGCSRGATVTLLTLSVGINGAAYAGYIVNFVDIARNHAATLSGISQTLSNITGFCVPYVVGLLLNYNPSLQNWQYVFFIAAAVYVAEVIFYVLFASGSEQPWNRGYTTATARE